MLPVFLSGVQRCDENNRRYEPQQGLHSRSSSYSHCLLDYSTSHKLLQYSEIISIISIDTAMCLLQTKTTKKSKFIGDSISRNCCIGKSNIEAGLLHFHPWMPVCPCIVFKVPIFANVASDAASFVSSSSSTHDYNSPEPKKFSISVSWFKIVSLMWEWIAVCFIIKAEKTPLLLEKNKDEEDKHK